MKFSAVLEFSPLLLFVPAATAWGTLGHETVAALAETFVQPNTKFFFQSLLNDTEVGYLARVATWADTYRYTSPGSFTRPFHFIDAKDNPPQECGVKFDRDCSDEGCIVRAIANYTSRVMDADLNYYQRQQAAKFIIHFIGDIHQPLHTELLSHGGNGINVTFSSHRTNLHAAWDAYIPNTLASISLTSPPSLLDAIKFSSFLRFLIISGSYRHSSKSWLHDANLEDPIETALAWATESNAYVCSTVLKGGVDAVKDKELNGTYFETAGPVAQIQIARAGVRLAGWLDLIAAAGGVEGKNAEEL